MNQRDMRDSMVGLGKVPRTCVCAQTIEAADMIELNYQFFDLAGDYITEPMILRFVVSAAQGDVGAVEVQAAANLSVIAIGNTRGLILDKCDTDGEFVDFYVRTIEPGPEAAAPTNLDSALSIQLTHVNVAGATLYAKLYNQFGELIDEQTVTWV